MYRVDNYYSDPRVIAASSSKWYLEFDESRMQAKIYDPDTEEEVWISCNYSVCPLCDGKGKHVNPSIDCNGLTAEDFAEDPDFLEDYKSGLYDIPCNECGGNRVVPDSDDPRVLRWREEEASYQMERAAELRFGG